MNKFVYLAMALTLLLGSCYASTTTRSISSASVEPEADLTVTLHVDVTRAETYYAIDELVPQGWTVKDAGSGSAEHSGHVKWVVIQDAQDTDLAYVLTAPNADGLEDSISGTYMFEGMEAPQAIGGQSSVVVTTGVGPEPGQQPSPPIDYSLLIVGLVVAVVVVVAAALMMKKK